MMDSLLRDTNNVFYVENEATVGFCFRRQVKLVMSSHTLAFFSMRNTRLVSPVVRRRAKLQQSCPSTEQKRFWFFGTVGGDESQCGACRDSFPAQQCSGVENGRWADDLVLQLATMCLQTSDGSDVWVVLCMTLDCLIHSSPCEKNCGSCEFEYIGHGRDFAKIGFNKWDFLICWSRETLMRFLNWKK